jgi:dienelactone hydrolase
LLIGGCGYVVPTVDERFDTFKKLTNDKNLTLKTIQTTKFDIYSVQKKFSTCRGKSIDLYIEGDGLPWITRTTVSDNPTPINPLGLKLFLKDSHECAVYLARPCQYISSSTCKQKYWTSHRFSSEIIESFNEALDKIKKSSSASSFRVFGYSGGGAIAALLAVKRDDIHVIVTIAGNLDIDAWTKEHYISPLYGSLNSADFARQLSKVEQYHLIGRKDDIVGESVFKSYMQKFKDKSNIHYKIYKSFNHHCCWEKTWKRILKGIDERTKDKF